MPSRNPFIRSPFLTVPALIVAVNLLCGFGLFHKKKYETPITKDTMQPDKVLFDRAIGNIEHGNYLAARLTLNTLINTYDTSEFLAKAKLAIADSWFREGDAHGLAQAEIEYKDFILFYPNMEEAAESQSKVCDIHIKQMSKTDRDNSEAQRAEDECRQVIVQFPNSKFRKDAEQKLRDVQEVLADKEFKTAEYYYKKGSLPAAQGRFSYVTQQYPLYSAADQALWEEADSYRKMGDRFENQEADALTSIVKNYPASLHLDAAKSRLTEMKRPVPDGDPAAYARMKYNIEHEKREGILSKGMGLISGRPFVGASAKQGDPVMAAIVPPVPVSVPLEAAGTIGQGATTAGPSGVSDVGIKVSGDSSSLDQKGDARIGAQGSSASGAAATTPAAGTAAPKAATGSAAIPLEPETPVQQAPLPTNHPYTKKQMDEMKKAQDAANKKAKKAADAAAKKPAKPAPAGTTPASATPANLPASAQQ